MKVIIFAALVLSPHTWSRTCQTLDDCISESKDYSYLPRYLQDKKIICQYSSSPECLKDAVQEANEILSCTISDKRKQEMAEYDAHLFGGFHEEYGSASVPDKVQTIFDTLIVAAEEISERTFPWKLTAYKANFINAHAGADAQVMASAALWAVDTKFEAEEMAAILAHEAAHVINDHSLKMGCLALEWSGPSLSLADAMTVFREDFSTATERGEIWSKTSNAIEYEADAVATKILKKAGMDPFSMAKALTKLKPKDGGGFSSGSHPEFDARIEAALRHARAQN